MNIFFRADDIGVPGKQFFRLIDIFSQFEVPLALAVVPVWITPKRWEILKNKSAGHAGLWCWHQHGWRHANHELTGKKQEFGPIRSKNTLKKDLLRGNDRMESILGNDYFRAFTPPWNRCGNSCLELLKENGYHAISRSNGAQPPAPHGLIDVQVNVDLHTIKTPDPSQGWQTLFNTLEESIVTGSCGIMIHHQRMNDNAFTFLKLFLKRIQNTPGIESTSLQKLAFDQ